MTLSTNRRKSNDKRLMTNDKEKSLITGDFSVFSCIFQKNVVLLYKILILWLSRYMCLTLEGC